MKTEANYVEVLQFVWRRASKFAILNVSVIFLWWKHMFLREKKKFTLSYKKLVCFSANFEGFYIILKVSHVA